MEGAGLLILRTKKSVFEKISHLWRESDDVSSVS